MNNYFNLIDTSKLDRKLVENQFPFSKYLFWDSVPEDIDVSKNKRYVIERVLTRGSLEDFYMLLKMYSHDEIQEALKKSKELDPKTVNFCSLYFNLPKSEMHVSSFYS
jgi:hypothetical protein